MEIVVTADAGDHEPSGNLLDILFEALDHGVRSLGPDGTFHPFVLVEARGQRELRRYVGETLAKSRAAAERALAALPAGTRMYAWAAVGVFRDEKKTWPAVVAEGGERGGPVAFRVAQRFQLQHGGGPPEPVGDLQVAGEVRNRLGGDDIQTTRGE